MIEVQRVETTSKIILSENDNNQTLINDRGVANHPDHTLPLLATIEYHFAIDTSHQHKLHRISVLIIPRLRRCVRGASDDREKRKTDNKKKYRNINTSGT